MTTMFTLVSTTTSKTNMAVSMAIMSASLYLGQFLNPFIIKTLGPLLHFIDLRGAFGVSFILSVFLFFWMFYIDKFTRSKFHENP